nr:hypothetical protein [Tanacetum cinerariifolium]
MKMVEVAAALGWRGQWQWCGDDRVDDDDNGVEMMAVVVGWPELVGISPKSRRRGVVCVWWL